MSVSHAGTSEVAIFSRVLEGDRAGFSPAAAQAILDLGFPQADKDRMRELSAKAREGILSPDEQAEISHYEIVGHILSLMKSKARRSLKRNDATNRKAEVR
jgi:hypothetical protein